MEIEKLRKELELKRKLFEQDPQEQKSKHENQPNLKIK